MQLIDSSYIHPIRPIAVVFLQGACSLRCPFCITDPGTDALRRDNCVQLLDMLADRGVEQVVLGGGEPCEWPGDWRWAAQQAHDRGFLVQLGTNGAPLPTGFETVRAVDRFVLPLDGAFAEVHNRLRPLGKKPVLHGVEAISWLDKGQSLTGHFAAVTDRLEILRQAGREVTLSTVITADNIAELPALAALITRYTEAGGRVHAWHLYRFIPEGRGGRQNQVRLAVRPCAYDAAVAMARRSAPQVRIFRRPDMRHSQTVDFYWFSQGRCCVGSEQWPDSETLQSGGLASLDLDDADETEAATG